MLIFAIEIVLCPNDLRILRSNEIYEIFERTL
jgi:hypothetical protein